MTDDLPYQKNLMTRKLGLYSFDVSDTFITISMLRCARRQITEKACEKRTTARKIGVPETCEYLLASRIDRTIHPRVHLPLRMSRVVP